MLLSQLTETESELCLEAFKRADIQELGLLTCQQLQDALGQLGVHFSHQNSLFMILSELGKKDSDRFGFAELIELYLQ